MLIIEGSDLTGKTTLAKRLVEELKHEGYIYRHLSRLPDGFDRYWGYRDLACLRIVQDRFHMSEPVYARVRGDDTCLTPETYRLVDGMLRGMGALTVVLACQDDGLIENRWREGEMYRISEVKYANDQYMAVVSGQFAPYSQMDYDYVIMETHSSPFPTEQDIHNILQCYRARQNRLFAVANSPRKPNTL